MSDYPKTNIVALRGLKRADARRKLTDEQLARIVELHGKGVTQTAIAERMGVTRSAVGLVLKNADLSTRLNK